MPADGFAFTVRVGRQQHTVGVLGLALQLFDELFLAFDADVLRRIVMLDVDAQLGGGQIADVAHAGRNFVVFAQIFADGLRLGRRLHDDEFCHYVLLLYINPHQPLCSGKRRSPPFSPETPVCRTAKGSPFGATTATAACGGNRELLLGPRPARCETRSREPQPGLGTATAVTESFALLNLRFLRAEYTVCPAGSSPGPQARASSGRPAAPPWAGRS